MRNTRRGFFLSDAADFSEEAEILLRRARQDIFYLIERGYGLESAVTFTGNHYQLSGRQRAALTRASCTASRALERGSRLLSCFAGRTVYIDGFNLLISLEAAQSEGTVLFLCADGTIRDLCGLHGTYRVISASAPALDWIYGALLEGGAAEAVFCLDAPVSNSRKLGAEVRKTAVRHGLKTEVRIVPSADAELRDKSCVASSDSAVLDRCRSWINLARRIIETRLPDRRLVDLSTG
jgi:hypothetical protein